MPTSSEVVAQRRREEAWDAYMAGIRAAEAARLAGSASAAPPGQGGENAESVPGDGGSQPQEPIDG